MAAKGPTTVRIGHKVVASATDAVSDILSGASLTVGGFGLSGVPDTVIAALADTDVADLEVISNN